MKDETRENRFRGLFRSDLVWIVLIYTAAWGFSLFNSGLFWDDWLLFDTTQEGALWNYKTHGYLIAAMYTPWLVEHVQQVLAYRAWGFATHLVIVLAFWHVLGKVLSVRRDERFFMALLMAVLPINFARISVSMTIAHNTAFLMFAVALLCFVRLLERPSLVFRFASLVLFAASFFNESQLVLFYAMLPLLTWILMRRRNGGVAWPLRAVVLRYADFWVLPFLFWFSRKIFFPPPEGYNLVDAQNILASPARTIEATRIFLNEFAELMARTARNDLIEVMLFGGGIFFLLVRRPFGDDLQDAVRRSVFLFGTGVMFFLAGIYAYAVVSKYPYYVDWCSRQQILLGPGLAFCIVFGTLGFIQALGLPRRLAIFVLALVMSVSTFKDFSTCIDYQRDAFKQQAIMDQLLRSDEMRRYTNIILMDEISPLNAMGREYRFYEISGFLKKVFGDTSRFGSINEQEWGRRMMNRHNPAFKFDQFIEVPPQARVFIEPGMTNLSSFSTVASLTAKKYLKPEAYQKEVADAVMLRIESIHQ